MADPKVSPGSKPVTPGQELAPYRPKSKAEIARNMSAIRSKDNRTETAIRKALHARGFRYRKYLAGLPGRPDIVFTRAKVAVFIDGDYWHARLLQEKGLEALKAAQRTESRAYWIAKFQRRVERDREVTQSLRDAGWFVLRFWESDTRRALGETVEVIAQAVRSRLGVSGSGD
jgi:DNA mismatch endonuclease, patch repair protein